MTDLLKDPKFAPLDLTANPPPLEKFHAELSAEDSKRIFEISMKVWGAAVDISGTVAEKYLQARGISCSLPPSLRYHPSCYHGPTKTRRPAMIALMTGAVNNKPQGIQRIYLNPDGSGKASDLPKHEQKMMLGKSEAAVIRLVDDAEITYGLGIAEGLETSLSVMSMGWAPVWAALSSGNIATFPILAAPSLTIFSDNDPPDKNGNRVGQDAARACGERWAAAGRDVFIKTPHSLSDTQKTDWNDVLIQKNAGNK